jgi:proteinaceous RNase P
MAIQMAAKQNDVGAALAAFDRAKAEGLRLSTDSYLSLLYLCGGGDAWEQQLVRAAQPEQQQQEQPEAQQAAAAGGLDDALPAADAASDATASAMAADSGSQQPEAEQQGGEPAPAAAAPLDAAQVRERAQQLFDEMKGSDGRLALNEMCYTALARLAAAHGDADRAFELVQASRAVRGGWPGSAGWA